MIKGANKNKEASIRIEAFAGLEIVHIQEITTRLTPSIVLLEFMEYTAVAYPQVTRYEMTIAY